MPYLCCWRSGELVFRKKAPRRQDLLTIIHVHGHQLRRIVTAIARHAYDGETLLVPGVPEAGSDLEAIMAVKEFKRQIERRLKPRIPVGAFT